MDLVLVHSSFKPLLHNMMLEKWHLEDADFSGYGFPADTGAMVS
jgi:hypothetical protein